MSHAHLLLPDSDEHLVPEGPERDWCVVVRNFSDARYDLDGDGLARRNVQLAQHLAIVGARRRQSTRG